MPTFDFPTLMWWGLPLATVPLAIHLINLFRHERVRFPAVEFLLASRRRYRTRVLLREVLLLLLRTAAILGIVLAVARPRWHDAGGGLFGGAGGRHVILVDDSYSMADRSLEGRLGDTTAFDRARAAVARIVSDLGTAAGRHELSIGRFSALAATGAHAGPDSASRTTLWDVDAETLSPQVLPQVRDVIGRLAVGFQGTTPAAPLEQAAARLGRGGDDREVLWIVSDFRARDWKPPAAAEGTLRRLAAAGTRVRLVACGPAAARDAAPNLTIERLAVAGGVPAVGVLVPLEFEVRNDGPRDVHDVSVTLREDGVGRPGVQLATIPAGGLAVGRFDARFPTPGDHLVEAELTADAVAADNTRGVVVAVVEQADVLVIDGDPRGSHRDGDAFFVAAALAPGPGAATGLRPRIEPPRALVSLDLSTFDTIWMLDCPRLDTAEIAALETYARAGGGVVFFTGPRTDQSLCNESLHRGGIGLFPVPLAGAVDLPPAAGTPDIQAGDHPVVAVLSGQRNPLLDSVRIDRVLAVPRDAAPDPAVRRLLSLRTGDPLIVEKPCGAGLVAAVLTTAAPAWNNWARGNPSWVVLMLELEAHLARGRRQGRSEVVGRPLGVRLPPGADATEVEFTLPDGTVVRQATAAATGGGLEASLPTTVVPGGHVARWRGSDDIVRERLFSVDVDPAEGRLAPAGEEAVSEALAGVGLAWLRADDLAQSTATPHATSLVRPLLWALAALLVAEQLLALRAGCHPAAAPVRSSGRRLHHS